MTARGRHDAGGAGLMPSSRPAGGQWLLESASPGDVFTPERFSAEHRLVARSVRTWLRREVEPLDAQLEQKNLPLMREVLRKAAALGVFAADVPTEYGGLGADRITGLLLAETISRGSVSSSVGAHATIGMLPIVYFGTPAQRARYLPRMAAGDLIGAYALTEPTAGSDALSIRTKAVAEPDGTAYRLSGTKQFITNGGIAGLFVLYAKVDGSRFTCFLVERDTPGFVVGPEEHKMGITGSSTTTLFLDGVRVPRDQVLGEVGRGHTIAFNILNVGRLKLAAGCVGAAKLALRDAVAYAVERTQFGRPIASFGLVKQKIAAMACDLYLAESMVYRTGGLLDQALAGAVRPDDGAPEAVARALAEYAPECAINKVFASEMLDRVVDETVQIHGGYGFIESYPAARAYRDARINRLYEGTNEINRLLIAGQLLRRAADGRLPLLDAARRAAAIVDGADAAGAAGARTVAGHRTAAGAAGLVARMKTVALACLSRATERFGTAIDEQQETLAWLSDQLITIFALESGLLRARQGERDRGRAIDPAASDRSGGPASSGLAAKIADYATAEAVPRFADVAAKIVTAVEDRRSKDAGTLAGLQRLLETARPDPVTVPRAIADAVIEAGGYNLGLPTA